MSSVAEILGLPPGVHFRPDDDDLVKFYLLPRARGEPVPFHGIAVVDDDSAGSTLPWDLLEHHGRGADDEAYFFVRSSSGDGATARQDRGCVGGGTWKSQKRLARNEPLHVAGEEIDWSRHNLNLHMGRGEGGGSVGWVMHEYALTDPSCAHLKICHVAFTGHGKNRKRVPGGGAEDRRSEPVSNKCARIDDDAAAAACGSASSGSASSAMTTVNQNAGVFADYQEPAQGFLTGDDVMSGFPHGLISYDTQGILSPASSAYADSYFTDLLQGAAAPRTEQQMTEHAMTMPLLPVVQQTAGMAEHQYPCGGGEEQHEFLASMGVTLDEFCDVSGIEHMTDAGAQPPVVVNWGGYQII